MRLAPGLAMVMTEPGETKHDVERRRRQRRRSIAIALALAGLVILFYIATIARLGGNVFVRPI